MKDENLYGIYKTKCECGVKQMKKAMISVTFDAEKLSAAKLYMAQKDLSFEEELEKAAEALYGKYVPAGVREFIELNAESKVAAKPKKLRQAPSSAVAVPPSTGGDPA